LEDCWNGSAFEIKGEIRMKKNMNNLNRDLMNIETMINIGYAVKSLDEMQERMNAPKKVKGKSIVKYASYISNLIRL